MEFAVGFIITFIALWGAYRTTKGITDRNPGLTPSEPILLLALGVWILVTFHRAAIWIPGLEGQGGYDGTQHENMARMTASDIAEGRVSLTELSWLSNKGYQSILGVFYAFTGAPNFGAVAIHALMAYTGLLFILESVALTIGQRTVPKWLVTYTMFMPSALIFTPWLLKEAPALWGIGILMRSSVAPKVFFSNKDGVLFTGCGAAVLFFMRPHIAGAWFLAAVIGHFSPVRKPITTVVVLSLALASYGVTIAAIDSLSPGFSEQAAEQGLTRVMDKATDHAQGGSAIVRETTPVPFVNGLIFIFFEPNPMYWQSFNFAIVGIEAWFITFAIAIVWFKSKDRVSLLASNQGLMCIVAILGIGFYLGFMYNMGLMVRQRLQVMPALVLLAAIPLQTRASENPTSSDQENRTNPYSFHTRPDRNRRVHGVFAPSGNVNSVVNVEKSN